MARRYWREYALHGKDPQGKPITLPLLYYFDETGTQLAWIQQHINGLWSVWIGRPAKFLDFCASLTEAKKLVQEELE